MKMRKLLILFIFIMIVLVWSCGGSSTKGASGSFESNIAKNIVGTINVDDWEATASIWGTQGCGPSVETSMDIEWYILDDFSDSNSIEITADVKYLENTYTITEFKKSRSLTASELSSKATKINMSITNSNWNILSSTAATIDEIQVSFYITASGNQKYSSETYTAVASKPNDGTSE